MSPTIREFLEPKEKKERHRSFDLDDVLDYDPRKYCPECSSRNIHSLHTHNVDGYDFKCENCKLNYTLWLVED